MNVRDFGAAGDAKSDDTAAFKKGALDARRQRRLAGLGVPPGEYLIAGNLQIPESVTLEGTFSAPPTTFSSKNPTEGSILFTTAGKNEPDGKPFITLKSSSTLKGVSIFYPEQTADVIAYPWCIRGAGDNCAIRDVLLVNPYQGVDFGTQPAGRHFISGLYGQPLKTGIFVDKCFDIGRIENVHFWPFWNQKLMDWMTKNSTAFLLARTDWEYMRDCFCISYQIGYHFIAKKDGPRQCRSHPVRLGYRPVLCPCRCDPATRRCDVLKQPVHGRHRDLRHQRRPDQNSQAAVSGACRT